MHDSVCVYVRNCADVVQCMRVYAYLHTYICCGVIIWSKFVCYKTPIVKKHYKNRGFSPFFAKTIARQNFKCYYLVQVDAF